MRAMIFSDLVTSKNSLPALFGMTVFVSLFIAIVTETLVVAVACMAAMVPFMYLFSISAYDEQNGWERFRLTLPISKKQVAYGRYASMLIIMIATLIVSILLGCAFGLIAEALPEATVPSGLKLSEFGVTTVIGIAVFTQLIILVSAIFTLPLIMRFGMTRGSRIVPIILVIALSTFAAFFSNSLDEHLTTLFFSNGETLGLFIALACAIALLLYVASAALSAWLYERREL
jgi:ABC-2 type transport system permease protein